MNKYDIAFIMYITGYKKETIENIYGNWIKVKDDPDFEKFHPDIANYLKSNQLS